MLGAVIGDLATDTWLRDKEAFYRQLIDEHARPSVYGTVALQMAQSVVCKERFDFNFGNRGWTERELIATVLYALCGWADDSRQTVSQYAVELHDRLHMEKEGLYAANILSSLVYHLRTGKSKREAAKESWGFDTGRRWDKGQDTSLGAVARALDAFIRSYDLTSALHIAVKSPVNPHLTATLTGMLAEAMYGCRHGMVKKKFRSNYMFDIQLPQAVFRQYSEELRFMGEYKASRRMFYPKNDASTNVERHQWTPLANLWKDVVFDKGKYRQLCLSFEPGWDNRYGIYLDDGWFYVYRSGSVLNRFRVEVAEPTGYRIAEVQKSDDNMHDDVYLALHEAFDGLECGWNSTPDSVVFAHIHKE